MSILPGAVEPWQRNQYALVLSVAVAHLGFDFSLPLIPLYVRSLGATDLGEAALWSGLLVGISPLISGLLAPFWGALGDRYGQKKLVLRALLALSLTSAFLGLAQNLWWALIARIVMGLFGGFTPAVLALAIATVPRDRVGQSVGMMQAAQFLPLAVGPLIGGVVADSFGLRQNFFVTSFIVGAATIVLFFLFRETETPSQHTRRPRTSPGGKGWVLLFGTPGFVGAAGILIIAQFSDRGLLPVIPLYLAEVRTPGEVLATVTGLVLSVGAVASAVSSWSYGRLATPQKARVLLALALTGGAVCLLLLALATRWEAVFALRLLLGLIMGGVTTLAFTVGARVVPLERAGLATGFLTLCGSMGNAIAPLVAGGLAAIALRVVFVVDAALLLLGLLIVLLLVPGARSESDPVRSA